MESTVWRVRYGDCGMASAVWRVRMREHEEYGMEIVNGRVRHSECECECEWKDANERVQMKECEWHGANGRM
jgi:hypothetical protein